MQEFAGGAAGGGIIGALSGAHTALQRFRTAVRNTADTEALEDAE